MSAQLDSCFLSAVSSVKFKLGTRDGQDRYLWLPFPLWPHFRIFKWKHYKPTKLGFEQILRAIPFEIPRGGGLETKMCGGAFAKKIKCSKFFKYIQS